MRAADWSSPFNSSKLLAVAALASAGGAGLCAGRGGGSAARGWGASSTIGGAAKPPAGLPATGGAQPARSTGSLMAIAKASAWLIFRMRLARFKGTSLTTACPSIGHGRGEIIA